jgi:hypothetical protein
MSTHSTHIEVTALEPGRYGVDLREGETRTSHKVAVSAAFLDDLGLTDVDPVRVVHESFAFLLDREPASAILHDFPIEQIARYFPDYYDELRARLGR